MKKKKIRKVILTIIILLAALLLGGFLFWKLAPSELKKEMIKQLSKQPAVRQVVATQVKDDYEEKVQDKSFDTEEIVTDSEVTDELSGYKNIVLFGVDARGSEFDSGVQSDTIMILSINNDTNAIRMASVYRDTYVNIVDNEGTNYYSKINAAYCVGGAKTAVSTLNANLDLDISDYIVVNFEGIQDIIDMLGGIDITVSETEMNRINDIIPELVRVTGVEDTPLTEYGEVHLNGLQATAFCRIRNAVFYDENGTEYHYDYGRTARQRYVMNKLIEKAKSLGVTELLSLTKNILNLNTDEKTVLKTSLSYDEIMDLVPAAIDYNLEKNTGFPFTTQSSDADGSDYVVPAGLNYNVTQLHQFLFDDETYEPSDTVKAINDYIINYTGVPEVKMGE